jgi:phage tail sheath protein FI
MSVVTSYPGIYIQELASNTHTIAAAPTSVTVFVGYVHPFLTPTANFGQALEIFSFSDYERLFGGFYQSSAIDCNVAYAVNEFFVNGGTDAYVVGLQPASYFQANGSPFSPPLAVTAATTTIPVGAGTGIVFTAVQPTDALPINIIINNVQNGTTADLSLTYGGTTEIYRKISLLPQTNVSTTQTAAASWTMSSTTITLSASNGVAAGQSVYDNTNFQYIGVVASITGTTLTLVAGAAYASSGSSDTLAFGQNNPNFIATRINGISQLVFVAPGPAYPTSFGSPPSYNATLSTTLPAGANVFNPADFLAVFQEDSWLDKVPIFNLLVIPGIVNNAILSEALVFAERKLAFFIMDPPVADVADGSPGASNTNWVGDFLGNFSGTGDTGRNVAPQSPNGALYFPYLLTNNPVTGQPTNAAGTVFSLPPSGYVAGIYAATDSSRGVWKAPAGFATTLLDTTGVVSTGIMTDNREGVLNLIGVNCIRSFPGAGTIVFGARTLVSANPAYQQWTYVPVRRMALFIEQTLKTNLTWVIFEPNDTPLWTAIRISIQAFMLSLFNQGAFAGTTPSDAFQVMCDSTTTTPTDQANGIVNIVVAFAPLRPAEFVIVKIAQLAGQASS